MLLLTRDDFLNHCSIQPLVICQTLSKFYIFTFRCFTCNVFHIIFSVNESELLNQSFGFLVGEDKRGGKFQRDGTKLG